MKDIIVISMSWNGQMGFNNPTDAAKAFELMSKGFGVNSKYVNGKSFFVDHEKTLKMEAVKYLTSEELATELEEEKRKEIEKKQQEQEDAARARLAEEENNSKEEVTND